MTDNTRYWIWFVMALRPGNERIWQMISPFENVKAAYEAVCNGTHPSLSSAEMRAVKTTHIEQCDSIIEYCGKKGFYILTFEDNNYPSMLRNIYNPPAVLFCMGDIKSFNMFPALSCVGTRNPSAYSLEVTETICSELARREFTIVSGFALGLDSAAHKGALKAGGRTAAVLACGLDVDYPRENAKSKDIIAKSGIVITEYLPGTRPDRYCFHTRNRIISGLTFGTLITEADEFSGALITAEHASDQGRTVFCIPPADIFDKRYAGVVKYLRDGAVPVFSYLDILYDYYTSSYFRMLKSEFEIPKMVSEGGDIPKRDSRSDKRKRRKSAEKKNVQEKSLPNKDDAISKDINLIELPENMSEEQTAVIDVLKEGEMYLDDIIERAGIDSFSILAVLTELEIMGAVELKAGRKYGLFNK